MSKKELSQDINLLFEAYETKPQRYLEITEKERYQAVKNKWKGLLATPEKRLHKMRSASQHKEQDK